MLIRNFRVAMAGTAGLAAVAIPTAAHATVAPVMADAAAAQSNPCDSFSTVSATTALDTSPTVAYVPSAGHESFNFNCILGRGSAGDGVYKLQFAMNKCISAGLTLDGQYGPATENAVRDTQAAAGFPLDQRDGVYGPKTSRVMLFPTFHVGDGSFARCVTFPGLGL